MSNIGDIHRRIHLNPRMMRTYTPAETLNMISVELATSFWTLDNAKASPVSFNDLKISLLDIACLAIKGLAFCRRLDEEVELEEQLPGYATCQDLVAMAEAENIAAYRVGMYDEAAGRFASVVAFPGTATTNLLLQVLETLQEPDPEALRIRVREVVEALINARGQEVSHAAQP